MVKAVISNFAKNSDFTTLMQRGRHIVNVSIPAGSYGYVTNINTDFKVEGEAHIENVLMEVSINPGERYPTNYAVFDFGLYYVYLMVYQLSIGTYRFGAVVFCPSGSASVTAMDATATVNLAVSPFS